MRRFYSLTLASVLLLLSSQAMAQENIHVRVSDYDTMWDFPFITDEISHFDISPSDNQLNAYSTNGIVIPFDADKVRQVTFEDAPAEETKDHYKVFQMYSCGTTRNPIGSSWTRSISCWDWARQRAGSCLPIIAMSPT